MTILPEYAPHVHARCGHSGLKSDQNASIGGKLIAGLDDADKWLVVHGDYCVVRTVTQSETINLVSRASETAN